MGSEARIKCLEFILHAGKTKVRKHRFGRILPIFLKDHYSGASEEWVRSRNKKCRTPPQRQEIGRKLSCWRVSWMCKREWERWDQESFTLPSLVTLCTVGAEVSFTNEEEDQVRSVL